MNTPSTPYTDADVELVAKAIHDVTPPVRDGYVDGSDLLAAEARAALDAVAPRIRAQAFREAADMVANCKPESTNRDFLRALQAFQTAIAAGLRISAKLTESAAEVKP